MQKTLNVGDSATLTRRFSAEDVQQYATLSGDHNPVHLDEAFAATTQFGKCIAHGMLVGSVFTALLGQQLPGAGCIYMGQNLKFRSPVFLDMDIVATVEVTGIHDEKPIVNLSTVCTDTNGKVLVTGDATMFVPWLQRA